MWIIIPLIQKEIFMAEIYQTTDGRQFGERYQAESHQRDLDGSSGGYSVDRVSSAQKREIERKNHTNNYNKMLEYYNAKNWEAVINLFNAANNASVYEAFFNVCPDALELKSKAEKKLWEQKNGRELKESDSQQYEIENIEKRLLEDAKSTNYQVHPGYAVIKGWEGLTGKKLTKKEQIRIAGRPFIKGTSGGGFLGRLFGKE